MIHLHPVYGIGIISGIAALVGWLVDAAVTIAAAVSAALAAMWAVLSPILFPLFHGLKAIWEDVLSPVWDKLKSWGLTVYKAYQEHIRPILDKLQKVAKLFRDTWDRFIRPIHDLVSVLDQFLRLTGLINTPFGQWLDGELTAFDQELDKLYRTVTAPINALLKIVNEYILDGERLLRPALLLASTARRMDVIVSQWWASSLQTVSKDAKDFLAGFQGHPHLEEPYANAQALIGRQAGPLSIYYDHTARLVRGIGQEDWPTVNLLISKVQPPLSPPPEE